MSYISHIEMCRVRHLNSGLQQIFTPAMRPDENGEAIQVPYSPNYSSPGQPIRADPYKCNPCTLYPVKEGHTCNITTVDVHSLLCVQ